MQPTMPRVCFLLKSGDTVLPEVMVARRLKIFLEDDLDRCFPRDRWVRALAHPTRLPAQVARCAGGEATAAATAAGGEAVRVEAGVVAATAQSGRVDGVESDGASTAPVPALRFSQIEPPKGDPCRVLVVRHCSSHRLCVHTNGMGQRVALDESLLENW